MPTSRAAPVLALVLSSLLPAPSSAQPSPPRAGAGATQGSAALTDPASALDPRPIPDAPALLDLRWAEARDGRVEPLHAWASVALFSGRARGGDATIVAPSLGLRFSLTEDLDVSAAWSLAYGVAHVAGSFDGGEGEEPYDADVERVEAANPTLAFSFSHAWGPFLLRAGLGTAIATAALAQAPTDAASAAARAASVVVTDAMLAMHAARDPWRFLPERLSFFVPITLALAADAVAGSLEAAAAWTIPVLGGTGDHEAALSLAAELAIVILPELRAGVRASVVGWNLGAQAPLRTARVQPAVEPWVRLIVGPAFVTLRATLDLGGDYGFGSADGGVWALHLGGGAALDRD